MNNLRFILFLLLLTIFTVLAFKNPFSERSLIPNIEPYPDTLYYSIPALNTVRGLGFEMKAFDYMSKIITPPLYSIFLIPFFFIFQDIRSFYFANIVLAATSLYFFLRITDEFFTDVKGLIISAFLGFFLVTNIYLYTQPSLLMAENITFALSMIALYLLVTEHTVKKSFIAGTLGVLLSLIKFSNIPLTIALNGLYFWKILRNKPQKKIIYSYVASGIVSVAVFGLYSYFSHIFVGHKNLSAGAGFGSNYFMPNFVQYMTFVVGQKAQYIWYGYRMVSLLIVIPMCIGVVIGLLNIHLREKTSMLLLYGLSVIIFMSFFYFVDSRYILVVLPILLVFAGIAIEKLLHSMSLRLSIASLGICVLLYLLLPSFGLAQEERMIILFKKQIGLNFKHAETPWHYIAVKEFNSFFNSHPSKKTYLGSFLHPYFVGAYANGNYEYLPIDVGQEFFHDKQNPPQDYTDLASYYTRLLKEGNSVYISPYFVNNNYQTWQTSYEKLTSHFMIKEVHTGCLGACNIYSLSLKK